MIIFFQDIQSKDIYFLEIQSSIIYFSKNHDPPLGIKWEVPKRVGSRLRVVESGSV